MFSPLALAPRKPLEIESCLGKENGLLYLQISSLLMETASFPRSASGFLRYPLFLIDFGQIKCVYKQDSKSLTAIYSGQTPPRSEVGKNSSTTLLYVFYLKCIWQTWERNCSNQDCRIQLGFCCLGKEPVEGPAPQAGLPGAVWPPGLPEDSQGQPGLSWLCMKGKIGCLLKRHALDSLLFPVQGLFRRVRSFLLTGSAQPTPRDQTFMKGYHQSEASPTLM